MARPERGQCITGKPCRAGLPSRPPPTPPGRARGRAARGGSRCRAGSRSRPARRRARACGATWRRGRRACGCGARVDGVAPHLGQQLVLAEDALGPAGQLVQQGELEPGQLERTPRVAGLEPAAVDAQGLATGSRTSKRAPRSSLCRRMSPRWRPVTFEAVDVDTIADLLCCRCQITSDAGEISVHTAEALELRASRTALPRAQARI
jgi:hypothetical protein